MKYFIFIGLLLRVLSCYASENGADQMAESNISQRIINMRIHLEKLSRDKLASTDINLDKETTDAEIKTLLPSMRGLPSMSVLDIEGAGITDEALRTISSKLSNLVMVKFTHTNITPDALRSFININKLVGIHIEGGVNINEESIASLKQQYPAITFDPNEILEIHNYRTQIKQLYYARILQFVDGYLNDRLLNAIMPILKIMPSLQMMIIKNCSISDESLYLIIHELPNLVLGQVENCPHISEQAKKIFDSSFQGSQVGKPLSKVEKLLKQLEQYKASPDIGFNQVQINDQEFSQLIDSLKEMQNLKALNLANCPITNESLILIAQNLQKLEILNLSGCENVTWQGIKSLRQALPNANIMMPEVFRVEEMKEKIRGELRNEAHLNCSPVKLTDEELKGLLDALKSMPNLVSIDLSHSFITEESLTLIGENLNIAAIKLIDVKNLNEQAIKNFQSKFKNVRLIEK